jgi:predicted RNase H-like nuclease (RuvC/YqgF family)
MTIGRIYIYKEEECMVNLLKSGKDMVDNVPSKFKGFIQKISSREKSMDNKSNEKPEQDEEGLVKGKFIGVKTSDRAAQDLISEVERFIRDREVMQLNNIEMKDTVDHLEQKVEKLSIEKDKLIYQFIDKEEELKELEEKLNEKHSVYELLLKEYKELQGMTSTEIKQLKSEIEIEKHKYSQLTQDFKTYRATANKDHDDLQERVRKLEAKNEDLVEQYKVKTDENAELMQSINQFSEQFTFNMLKKKAKDEASIAVESMQENQPEEDIAVELDEPESVSKNESESVSETEQKSKKKK